MPLALAPRFGGRFQLLDRLGAGAYGAVWKARDLELKRTVAIKTLHPGLVSRTVDRERFYREARAAAQLRHPGIVTVYEVAELDGCPAIISEHISGVTLREWIEVAHPSPREISDLISQVAEALDYAGLMGVVHRDIKPSNIMVEAQVQGPPRALIVDFGLALQEEFETTLTTEGQLIGTPAYMSPEQAAGLGHQVDRRSDIYSLGVVLYELLCGRTPFTGSKSSLLHQVMQEEPRSLRSIDRAIPRDLETICLKAMAKSPGDRYDSGRELADDLGRWRRGEAILARPAGTLERALRWCRRNPVVAGLLTAVILLLSIVAVGGTLTTIRLRASRHETLENLRQSYHAQARAQRMTHEPGRRFASLEALAKAARIRPGLDLRNEAVACMPLVDIRVIRTWIAREPGISEKGNMDIDPGFDRFAVQDSRGKVVLRRVEDGVMIREWDSPAGQHVKFSADGRYVGAGGVTEFRAWDVASGDLALKQDYPGLGYSFGSPGGHPAIVLAGEGELGIFDLTSRDEVRKIRISGARGRIWVAVNPTGDAAAVQVPDQGLIRIVDLVSLQTTATLNSDDREILAWHPDGRRLALNNPDDIEIWNLGTGALERTLKGHLSRVTGAEFDPQGELLVSEGWDGLTRIWDCHSGEEILHAPVHFLRWSADGRKLAFAVDSLAGVWEVARGDECRTLRASSGDGGGPWSVVIHPNGRLLGTNFSDGVRLWDLVTGKEVALLPTGNSFGLAFQRDGTSLITAGERGVHRWSLEEDSASGLWRVGPPEILIAPSEMPRDRAISFGPDEEVVIPTMHDSVRVISPRHPERSRTFGPHAKASWAGMSPDGLWVLTGTQFGQGLRLWDAKTGRLVRELPGGGYGRGVFDSESRWLLTDVRVSGTNLLRIGTWESFHLPGGGLGSFTSDGNMIAVAPNLGNIVLRNTETREELARLTPALPLPIAAGADPFTPDGGTLVAGCYTRRLLQAWDLRSIRRQLREMNLDWEPPLPSHREQEPARVPYRVQVSAGDLAATPVTSRSK